MGFLDKIADIFNKNKVVSFDTWHAETDIDKFSGIEQNDIESYLSRIADQIYEFVILTPPEPVENVEMVHVCRDDKGALRLEMSLTGDNIKKVLAKNGLSNEEILNVLIQMAGKNTAPKFDDWETVGSYADPKSVWLEKKLDGSALI